MYFKSYITGKKTKVDGGAIQLTLYRLCVDHYPFHPNGILTK